MQAAHLLLVQRSQRIRARVLGCAAIVSLVADVLLDGLPADDGTRLFDQHQAGVDQDEGVSGYIKALPQMTSLQTARFGRITWKRTRDSYYQIYYTMLYIPTLCGAASVGVLHDIKQLGPEEPEEGGYDDAREMVSQHPFVVATRNRIGREHQEGHHEEQRPAPADLHEVLVEQVVRSGEVRLGEGHKVPDYGDHKQTAQIQGYFEVRIEEYGLLAQMDDAHDQDLANASGCGRGPRSARFRPGDVRSSGPEIHVGTGGGGTSRSTAQIWTQRTSLGGHSWSCCSGPKCVT